MHPDTERTSGLGDLGHRFRGEGRHKDVLLDLGDDTVLHVVFIVVLDLESSCRV